MKKQNFKKVLSVFLSLIMVVTLVGFTATPVAAKTAFSHMESMLDVSDATGTGTINVAIQDEEVSSVINNMLFNFYWQANNSFEKTDEEGNLTPEMTKWISHVEKMGVAKLNEEQSDLEFYDNLNVQVKISSQIVTSEVFSLELNVKIANGPEIKLTKLEYNKGNIKVDVQSLINFIATYADADATKVYEILGIPSIKSLELDGIEKINNYLTEKYGEYYPIEVLYVTQEDIDNGDYEQDELGKIKGLSNAEEPKTATFALTSTDVINAVKNFVGVVLNTTDSTFEPFETTTGNKTSFNVTEEQADKLVKALSNALSQHSITLFDVIFGQAETIFADAVGSIPTDGKDYLTNEYIETINSLAKALEDIANETVTVEDGEGNQTEVNALLANLKAEKIKFNLGFNSELTGEKGNRCHKVDGSFSISAPEIDLSSVLESYDVEGTEEVEEAEELEDQINITFNYELKESVKAPVTENPTPAVTNDSVTKFTVNKKTYKVTSGATAKVPTVAFVGQSNKKAKKLSVPATVKYKNVTYKVTSIAANAFKNNKKVKSVVIGKNVKTLGKNSFKGCKNLKSIIINSKNITKVSAGALKNVSSKITIKCPKGKLKKYKKLFKKKSVGYKKSWKIK